MSSSLPYSYQGSSSSLASAATGDQYGRGSSSSSPSLHHTYTGEFSPIPHQSQQSHSPLRYSHPSGASFEYPSTSHSPYQEALPLTTNSSVVESLSVGHLPEIYEVHFKRTMDLFIRGYSEAFKIGDFVKVEADRGFDLGVIALILAPGSAEYPYHSIPRRRVLSLANDDEKAFLLAKIEEEYRALDICREFATRRQMKINVLDAELQFDRRKLTFLFTSEKHTDFRELVRDLFSIFKTRIWMQKINPAQAASLEQDCKNSHFPTLPSMIRSQKHGAANESSHNFEPGALSPPESSPTRGSPKQQLTSHHHNSNAARSASFASTGSASTFEEEDEEDMYLAERARRVGGVRGIRGEGDHLSITFTGGAGSRAGARGLSALNVPPHSSVPHTLSYPRMAMSLPQGLGHDGQALYSLGNNHYEAPLRSNSGMSERSLYGINNDPDRSVSLPTALPSHHWSSYHSPAEYQDSNSTTNASNSVASVDNVFTRNLSQYAGIPISSRQLQTFEMQQQRYLTEKYHPPPLPHSHPSVGGGGDNNYYGDPTYHHSHSHSHSHPHHPQSHHHPQLDHPHPTALESIFSQADPVSDLRIDDIHISLPTLGDSLQNSIPFPVSGPPLTPLIYSSPTLTPGGGVRKNSSPGTPTGSGGYARRSFTTAETPLDITIQTDHRAH